MVVDAVVADSTERDSIVRSDVLADILVLWLFSPADVIARSADE